MLLVGLAAGYLLRKRVPPYDLGIHDASVKAPAISSLRIPPRIGSCPVFPADNVWNTPIDRLNKDHSSDAYLKSIGSSTKFHASFGADLANGVPFTEIPDGTRPIQIPFDYQQESDRGEYPMPDNAPIERAVGPIGDHHVLLIDTRRCILYELWHARRTDQGWDAGSGIKMDLTSNALRPDGATSADAAGLPVLPGLVRYEEVASGEIRHALRFTIPRTQNAYIWPARHKASLDSDPTLPPMGARLRLRADFDISKFSAPNQVIMTALKRYGMFLADTGGALYVNGVPDKRWDDADLRKLRAITAADFEVVDEAGLQLLPDSARVDPLALPR